jgi:OOP family OmpA-OmpF porin
MRIALLSLASLLLLSACADTESLSQLRMAKPVDDPYYSALAEGYKNYAEDKAVAYDWNMSKYFADKGLMAAYGRDVAPEYASNWDVGGPEAAAQLGEAREALSAALSANRSTQPALSAATVVAYDRWLESIASHAEDAVIDERREAFLSGLNSLEAVHVAQAGVDAPSSEPEPESTATILYFPFDSDRLGDSAKAALKQMVHDVLAAGNAVVSINGHADRAGAEPYNLSLSERRAKFVLKALKAAGVPEKRLKYLAFGESDPVVATEDGAREPKNRRVEIFIE